MPFIVGGDVVPGRLDVPEVLKSVSEASEALAAAAPRAVGPREGVCILQREFGIALSDAPPFVIGSVEATTCCIVSVWAPPAPAAADGGAASRGGALLSHLDLPAMVDSFCSRLRELLSACPGAGSRERPLEVTLAGSFPLPGSDSEALVTTLLHTLHKLQPLFVLRAAAVLDVNRQSALPGAGAGAGAAGAAAGEDDDEDDEDGAGLLPRIVSLAVDTRTGEAFPAAFASYGPAALARGSYIFLKGGEEEGEFAPLRRAWLHAGHPAGAPRAGAGSSGGAAACADSPAAAGAGAPAAPAASGGAYVLPTLPGSAYPAAALPAPWVTAVGEDGLPTAPAVLPIAGLPPAEAAGGGDGGGEDGEAAGAGPLFVSGRALPCLPAVGEEALPPALRTLPPGHPAPSYDMDRWMALHMLNLSPAELLESTSTSPHAEAPHYAAVLKAQLRFIIERL